MTEEFPRNHRRSDLTGKIVQLRQCRLFTASNGELGERKKFRGDVNVIEHPAGKIKEAITAINLFYWGSLEQDVFGRTYDVMEHFHIVAIPNEDDEVNHRGIAGHIGYCIEDEGFLHIIVFQVWPKWMGSGAGTRLLKEARNEAERRGVKTIKLGTTNDNLPALYFYQRHGFVIEDVAVNAVTETNGSIMTGFAGIPVRDEIHMRMDL